MSSISSSSNHRPAALPSTHATDGKAVDEKRIFKKLAPAVQRGAPKKDAPEDVKAVRHEIKKAISAESFEIGKFQEVLKEYKDKITWSKLTINEQPLKAYLKEVAHSDFQLMCVEKAMGEVLADKPEKVQKPPAPRHQGILAAVKNAVK
jgi:hypothetical protein